MARAIRGFTPNQSSLRSHDSGLALNRQRSVLTGSGQATIETTLGLIIVFILLAATIRLFSWFTTSIVGRQNAFQRTRLTKYADLNDPNGWINPHPYDCDENDDCTRPNDQAYYWYGAIRQDIEADYYQPKKLSLLFDAGNLEDDVRLVEAENDDSPAAGGGGGGRRRGDWPPRHPN